MVLSNSYAVLASQSGVFAPFAAKLAGRVCAASALGAKNVAVWLDTNQSFFGGDPDGESAEVLAVLRRCRAEIVSMSAVDIVRAVRRAAAASLWYCAGQDS